MGWGWSVLSFETTLYFHFASCIISKRHNGRYIHHQLLYFHKMRATWDSVYKNNMKKRGRKIIPRELLKSIEADKIFGFFLD
jgi:capsule polysaccharide modification protein KpsS